MATTWTWEQVIVNIEGIVNRGNVSKTFTPSGSEQSYTVEQGYHGGSGVVKCSAVSLSGNADAGHVLKDKTFYKDSLTKQTGTMANNGELNWKPNSSTTKSVSAGYYSGGTLDSSDAYTAGYNAAPSEKDILAKYNGFTHHAYVNNTSVNATVNWGSVPISLYNSGVVSVSGTKMTAKYKLGVKLLMFGHLTSGGSEQWGIGYKINNGSLVKVMDEVSRGAYKSATITVPKNQTLEIFYYKANTVTGKFSSIGVLTSLT